MLLGFSRGACLNLEFVARNAPSYGGVPGLSGGLIGPDGTPRDYPGSLAGTPVFLGCSDVDFHVPKERVQLTAEVLRSRAINKWSASGPPSPTPQPGWCSRSSLSKSAPT